MQNLRLCLSRQNISNISEVFQQRLIFYSRKQKKFHSTLVSMRNRLLYVSAPFSVYCKGDWFCRNFLPTFKKYNTLNSLNIEVICVIAGSYIKYKRGKAFYEITAYLEERFTKMLQKGVFL